MTRLLLFSFAVPAALTLALVSHLISAGAQPSAVPLRHFARPSLAAPLPGERDDGRAARRASLGLKLFRDKRLSQDQSYACESCHYEGLAFADPRERALGFSGQTLERNTPPIWNLAWALRFGWAGRDIRLEEQVLAPVVHATEMGGDWPQIVARLRGDAAMVRLFAETFPGEGDIDKELIARALASYVRSIVSPPTRFDRFVEGDDAAVSDVERRGFELFAGKAGCAACHRGWRFTDDAVHATGFPYAPALRTPTLRELLWSGPYLHDGSAATVAEAVARHAAALASTGREGPAPLDAESAAAVTAFLATLSSEDAPRPVARP